MEESGQDKGVSHEDSLQLIGEVIAIVAGIAATVQFVRKQAAGHRVTS